VPDRPFVRRRTAVAGALGGLATALLAGGCDAEDLRPPEDDESTPVATTEPGEPTADEVLVDEVLAALAAAVEVLTRARTVRTLHQPLGSLARAHRAHVDVLGGEPPAPATAPGASDASVALREVRRSEQRLQTRLADAAGRAESGALARLLASVSASVSQHLAALPVLP
jgi:hypothetical protein